MPNTDIDTLKNALGGTKDSQSKFFKRMQKFNEKYQELFDIDKEQWYKQYPKISYTLNKERLGGDDSDHVLSVKKVNDSKLDEICLSVHSSRVLGA